MGDLIRVPFESFEKSIEPWEFSEYIFDFFRSHPSLISNVPYPGDPVTQTIPYCSDTRITPSAWPSFDGCVTEPSQIHKIKESVLLGYFFHFQLGGQDQWKSKIAKNAINIAIRFLPIQLKRIHIELRQQFPIYLVGPAEFYAQLNLFDILVKAKASQPLELRSQMYSRCDGLITFRDLREGADVVYVEKQSRKDQVLDIRMAQNEFFCDDIHRSLFDL